MALEFSIEIDDNGTPKLKKFQKETKQTGKISEKASKSIAAISKGLAIAGAAASAGGVALFGLSKKTAEFRDQVTKSGRELGVTTEFLSGLGHAAQLGGTDLKTAEKALLKMGRTAFDADSGLATAKKAFSDLGIQIKDSNGVMKTNESLLFEISDKFSQMPDGLVKAAKAQEIFGRSGKNLINTLNQGSAALKDQMKEAEELGIAFDQKAGEQAEAFNDSLLRLETTAAGVLAPIGASLIPKMTDAFIDLASSVKDAGPGLIRAFEDMEPVISNTLGLILDTARGWSDLLSSYGKVDSETLNRFNEALEITAKLTAKEVRNIKLTQKELIQQNKLKSFLLQTNKDLGLSVDDLKIKESQALIIQLKKLTQIEGASKSAIASVEEEISLEQEKITNIRNSIKAKEEEAAKSKKAESDKLRAERAAQQRQIDAARRAAAQKATAKREAERHAKEMLKIEEKQLQEQEKMLDEIFNKIKEEQDQEQALREEKAQKIKETEQELTNFFKSENDLRIADIESTYNKRVELLGKTTEVEKARMMEIAELQSEIEQQRRDNWEMQFNQIGEFANIASTTLNNIYQKDQNNINNRFDERQQKIEESFASQIKAAEGNAKKEEELARRRDEKLKALDVKREKELQRSAKKTATARKRAAQLEAIVNTAAAVTKALPNIPLSVAVGLQGASQVALIESQQFFKGGMTGESGQENISVGENGREFVVSSGGTRQAGEAALQDINNGRLEDAANRLLAQSNRPSGGITLQINGGVIDEQFLENSLIPRMKEFERRF